MQIRTATIDDLNIIAGAELRCFTPEEAASIQSIERRLRVYPDHFWLLVDDDGSLISFVDGLVTNDKDLTDLMYEDESIHDENGAWQMIFGVVTVPSARKKGYAARLLMHVINEAKAQGRKGLVLTCHERLINYYSSFGFINEGITEQSVHGGIVWYQMRLTF